MTFFQHIALELPSYISIDFKNMYVKALLVLVIGFPIILMAARLIRSVVAKNISKHFALLLHNTILYLGTFILVMMALREMDVQLSTLLGTAGILTIALSFAAQTSLSNLISGLFLLGEKPFQVGDFIEVNSIRGYVIGIDLMSVKLRTRDNRYVRVPNESIIKTDLINLTRFPIRRLDMLVPVSREENIQKVLAILHDIADKDTHSLDEPKPLILLNEFGESSLVFLFGPWCHTEDFFQYCSHMRITIKERFDEEGISIPYPHITLNTKGPVSMHGGPELA